MLKRFIVSIVVVAFALPMRAEDAPDLSQFNEEQLRAIAAQLYKRVAELEAEVAALKAAKDAGSGDEESGPTTEWVITVTGNEETDVAAARAQLEAARARQTELEARARELSSELTKMQGEQVMYRDRDGKQKTKSKYSNADLAPQRAALARAQSQARQALGAVRQLEREIAQASSTRIVTGMSESGVPVRMLARGPYQTVAASMEVGKTYRVTGAGFDRGGEMQVVLRGAVAME